MRRHLIYIRDSGTHTLRWKCSCGAGTPERKGALGTIDGSVGEALEHLPGDVPFVITRLAPGDTGSYLSEPGEGR